MVVEGGGPVCLSDLTVSFIWRSSFRLVCGVGGPGMTAGFGSRRKKAADLVAGTAQEQHSRG